MNNLWVKHTYFLYTHIMAEYLDRIIELLSKHGEQTRVAKETGIPARTIRAYRLREMYPPPDRLEAIAEALGKQIVVADK